MHWVRVEIVALAQFAVIAYLAAYLMSAGPVLRAIWNEGGHATPELWAQHKLLDALGFAHHHNDHHHHHGVDSAMGDQDPALTHGARTAPGEVQVTTAPTLDESVDGVLHLTTDIASAGLPMVMAGSPPLRDVQPRAYLLAPPTKPPSSR